MSVRRWLPGFVRWSVGAVRTVGRCEYGHHVEWWLEQLAGAEEGAIRQDYAALRGLDVIDATGGRWHEAAGEVLADDFRLVVAGVELEHWPHPGIDRPGPDVIAWWSTAHTTWLDHIAELEEAA